MAFQLERPKLKTEISKKKNIYVLYNYEITRIDTSNTLGELEKSCGNTRHSARVPTAFLILPNFKLSLVFLFNK